MIDKKQIVKYLKPNDDFEYYMIDSDRFRTHIDGVSRIEAFDILVDDGVINVESINKIGIMTFVRMVNAILDGRNNIGRFSFFRVGANTLPLEQQMKNNQLPFTKRKFN